MVVLGYGLLTFTPPNPETGDPRGCRSFFLSVLVGFNDGVGRSDYSFCRDCTGFSFPNTSAGLRAYSAEDCGKIK